MIGCGKVTLSLPACLREFEWSAAELMKRLIKHYYVNIPVYRSSNYLFDHIDLVELLK